MRTVFIEGDCNMHTCDDYARRFVAICNYDHLTHDEYIPALRKAKALVEKYKDREKEKEGWWTLVDDAPPEAWEALKFKIYDLFMSTQQFQD